MLPRSQRSLTAVAKRLQGGSIVSSRASVHLAQQLSRYAGRNWSSLASCTRVVNEDVRQSGRRTFSSIPRLSEFVTVDPRTLSGSQPHTIRNLQGGKWTDTASTVSIVDPLNGQSFIKCPDTSPEEISEFVANLKACPKSGVHNPFKNPERYVQLAHVSNRAGQALRDSEIGDFFARLIQRVSPKSYAQAMAEVKVTAQFLENFSGDQVRFMARSFGVAGDHLGQMSRGYRWPFGAVAVITPFNFPLEIPVLQLMGALFMGNFPILKVDSKVAIVMEQFLRLLHHVGLEEHAVDFVNCDGPVMQRILRQGKPRNTLFTGSSKVAEILAKELRGKVKLEDAGFDWKVLGPDVPKAEHEIDYVAWVCDQDAYACSGQKCSAQSLLFMHRRWKKTHLLDKMRELAQRRRLDDLTIGPVLTWTTEKFLEHTNKLLDVEGAELLWGGKELEGHSIPDCYAAVEPTAVYVPLKKLRNKKIFELATTEVFGPFQVVTDYADSQVDTMLQMMEKMQSHLTAAVVSKDEAFRNRIIGSTVNGTTYSGIRARTTGAPQNHWFGPAGDPRGAGIGTVEAIKMVWSCHREVIDDVGPIPKDWTTPEST